MEEQQIQVLIADDVPVITVGLATVLGKEKDLNIVGKATSKEQILAQLRHKKIDVIVLDLKGVIEIEEFGDLLEANPGVKLIVLTVYDNMQIAQKALKHGAKAFLSKWVGGHQIVNAIRTVYQGGISILVQDTYSEMPPGCREAVALLTPREKEVACLISKGNSAKMVASELGNRETTVHAQLNSIYRKLEYMGVHNAAGLAAFVVKCKLGEE